LVLYDSANDSELTFYDAGGLMAWLDLHESEYEGFTELQMKLMGDLLPKVVKEWAEEDGSSA
jgi:hypothetical protein